MSCFTRFYQILRQVCGLSGLALLFLTLLSVAIVLKMLIHFLLSLVNHIYVYRLAIFASINALVFILVS